MRSSSSPIDSRDPTPDEMISVLSKACRKERWSHFRHDFHKHSGDWSRIVGTLTDEEYRDLPLLLVAEEDIELYTYIYHGRRVWGFFSSQVLFQKRGQHIENVGVIYDPQADETVHCMRVVQPRRYFRSHRDVVFIPKT